MSNGVLLFAHNSRQIDYIKLSLIAGALAKKNLKVPVSLVTDKHTLAWAESSKIYDTVTEVFENVIIYEPEDDLNHRILHDGNSKEKIPFKNSSRAKAWNLTPYDRTLLIDSDYLIFSKNLSNYWNVETDFLIGPSIKDLNYVDRMQHCDRYVSDVGIKLLWATTIMFTKNQNSKIIFDFVDHIRTNYIRYSEIYRFDSRVYRNDIAFSVALHTLSGFISNRDYSLPPVLSTIDRDYLFDIKNQKLQFLIEESMGKYLITSVSDTDIHVMNKQSIIRNYEKLMELS